MRPGAPSPNEVLVSSVTQEIDGPWRRLRGKVRLETTDMVLTADEVDYNVDQEYVEARGNVHFIHVIEGQELFASKVEYNMDQETGKFYDVRGSAKAKIDARPGILTTSNPFSFQGEWADKLKDRYILHNGFITNCRIDRPWWRLRAPKFDVIPNDRAIAYRSVFWLRGVPLFYSPAFYKSLAKQPRKSGFLMPSIGNSSRRGLMYGGGYYWAINRSYDLTYRVQNFTERGLAHHADIRGKPRAGSDFNATIYGVNDRGRLASPDSEERISEGGLLVSFTGQSDLGKGFLARGTVNYLSSFKFRQAFTESFNEAIFSEVQSLGYITRNWSDYNFNLVFARSENFQSDQPGDKIVVRKLPQLEFAVRDRPVIKELPVWVSLESSAGLVRRNQPLFQTQQFVERADLTPRVMTSLDLKGFRIVPSFAIRETYYGATQSVTMTPEATRTVSIVNEGLLRSSRELAVELIPPSLERTFKAPKWLGDRIKHVIEPRAGYRHVSGIGDFDRIIRFDEMDVFSNTSEADLSITNRFYVKKDGQVHEALSWQIMQRRYFNTDFGGAIKAGERNVVWSQLELTPYAFLDGPRNYSPVISSLRANPTPYFGVEWRADYDPRRGQISNSGLNADARVSQYFVSVGHNHVRSVPLLSPSANQFRGLIGYGADNRRGWNAAFSGVYDFRIGAMQYSTTQVSYNSDCCGVSVQYRRFSFGNRDDYVLVAAFVVANIGSFGTLKRQERLF